MRSDAERRRLISELELEHEGRRAVRAHRRRLLALALVITAAIGTAAAALASRIARHGCEVVGLPFGAPPLLVCQDRGGLILELLR